MKLYKTSKAVGVLCFILAALFIALGVILITNPDEENYIVLCVLLFIFAAVMLGLGIMVVVVPTRIVHLTDKKLVFERFKYEPKTTQYADEAKKTLSIPVSEIEDFQIQGASKSSSFLAAFLGGAIGAAIVGNRNPDKLIVKTKESQVVIYIPQAAGNRIKDSVKLNKEQTVVEAKLDSIESLKPLDEEE